MATSISTTYAGEFAGKYISAALLSGKTLGEETITILPNIVHKQIMQKVSSNDIVKNGVCDYSDSSTITLSERTLTLEDFMVNVTVCKKDFLNTWQAAEVGLGGLGRELPKSFADFIIGHFSAKVAQRMETNIWAGVNGTAGQFDGFKALLAADSDVVDVVATDVNSGNVITELGKVADAIPSAVYGQEDTTIWVATNVYRSYIRALGGFGASGLGAAGYEDRGNNQIITPAYFDGIKISHAQGLGTNEMVAGQKSNFFFGTSLLNDLNEIKVIDMSDIDGSQNVRFIMRFQAGVQFGVGSDCVQYT